jgi:hypothetical protein
MNFHTLVLYNILVRAFLQDTGMGDPKKEVLAK